MLPGPHMALRRRSGREGEIQGGINAKRDRKCELTLLLARAPLGGGMAWDRFCLPSPFLIAQKRQQVSTQNFQHLIRHQDDAFHKTFEKRLFFLSNNVLVIWCFAIFGKMLMLKWS